MLRTHDAGSLNASLVGQTVTLAGWVARRRDHGGVAFLDLRDASGIAQVVVHDEATFSPLRNEFVVKVTGEVKARPEGSENPNLASGEIEVHADSLEVLNSAAALPFQVDEHVEVGEETRLQYRYLDLRRPKPAANLRLRSEANKAARRVLEERNFLEVETPTMTRSTPEGARDFIVPARLAPGKWYALPQSPQLFKQLLQVGGVERYYQLARCYRDEDFRADRQPEFTQLDIEASFVDQEDIIALGEAIVKELWKLIGVEIETPIRRMTYQEAMTKYGSDKPDLRFDNPITELKEFFKDTEFRVFQQEYVGAVVMPGGASQPRRQLDGWQEWAKQHGGKGLAYVLVQEDGELTGPVAKNLTDFERENLAETVGAKPGDCIFFGAGPTNSTRQLLGQARVEIAHRTGMIKDGDWAFVWVVDAPMFMSTAEAVADGDVAVGDGKWTAVHHAFTAPKPEFLDTFDTDSGTALTNAYDIVCNGNEIGGGSIRIHRRDVQERVFKVMGVDEKTQQEQFGFLLEGFKYGAPPHGGIAFGWDRVVSLLAGETSIREVIAFPKTGGGFDPLTAAPAEITPQRRKEAGVDAKPAEQTKDGATK
ncbi:aspartate--tRNA ligase [Pseudoglutamicibacter cumminsii]|uniref:aspartate--tRNA ligase n=1 Tax=Pseudoglutamicibacter cumminsii TaxID=156979 RepID=UPI002ABAD792|nr:aspartate--tRNA ligase [Pseudoglutamicibacter cumminsii]MDZ3745687.1 aspartate--tRNA ligase [Pseudoglutamicibacter cumminsii]